MNNNIKPYPNLTYIDLNVVKVKRNGDPISNFIRGFVGNDDRVLRLITSIVEILQSFLKGIFEKINAWKNAF